MLQLNTFHFYIYHIYITYISPNTHTLVINSFLFTRRRLQLGSRKLVLNKILVRERLYIFNNASTVHHSAQYAKSYLKLKQRSLQMLPKLQLSIQSQTA